MAYSNGRCIAKDGRAFSEASPAVCWIGLNLHCCLVLYFHLLLGWFTPPAYHEVWPIVCILAWQALLYGFFLIASAGIWKSEKTHWNLPLNIGAVLVGILLNWALVPEYGMIGASMATVITYFLWIIAALLISEKMWKVNFQIKIILFQLFVSMLFMYGFCVYLHDRFYISAVITICISLFILFITLREDIEEYYLKNKT